MSERLHILITAEHGKTIKFHTKRRKFCIIAAVLTISFIVFGTASIFTFPLLTANRSMSDELAELRIKTDRDSKFIAQLQQNNKAERARLAAQIAQLKTRNDELTTSFEQEKDELLATAVSELNMRNELIDTMMKKIGVKISGLNTTSGSNSGGPFIAAEPGLQGELLDKTDHYLKAIKALPLGRPVPNRITSYFGPRKDPLNKRSGFHEGIDFGGRRGDKIFATANGVVKKAYRNRSYGNYVEIDHGNGYRTCFAHMNKFTVKKGDKVKRGQLIGYIGNTGRSTGPHLHYEVRYRNKPVNPLKFMQVAKLIEQ